jgi:hypothetical protein
MLIIRKRRRVSATVLVPVSFCDDQMKEVEMRGSFAGGAEMITAYKILLIKP